MKPILFNTDMVRAILDGRKTVTRRAVKFRHGFNPYWSGYVPDGVVLYGSNNVPAAKAPYRPGDILYVRETWCDPGGEGYPYLYKADMPMHWDAEDTEVGIPVDLKAEDYKWRRSIHMPLEAARIFLWVTDVRVERLQSITELDILEKEGVTVDFPQPKPSYASLAYAETRLKPAVRKAFADLWNACYSKPQPVKVKGVITHYESYPWEDIQETRTYRGKPWYIIGNPWTWGIEFERCEKP